MIDLHWFGIIVVAVINMALGALWYSPILFGKKWMALMGKKEGEMMGTKEEMLKSYVVTFIGALVMAFILALFAEYRSADTFLEGAIIGFLAWLGFVVPTNLSTVIFEKKTKEIYYINMGYYLVSFILMGGILSIW